MKIKQKTKKKEKRRLTSENLLEAGASRLVVARVPVAAGSGVVPPPVAAPVSPPASPASAVVAVGISATLGSRSALASVVFAWGSGVFALQVGRVPVYQLGQFPVDAGLWMDGVSAVPSLWCLDTVKQQRGVDHADVPETVGEDEAAEVVARLCQVVLTKNEWPWAIRSHCSEEMSERERIAQVAHQKWANEWITRFFSKLLIRSFLGK